MSFGESLYRNSQVSHITTMSENDNKSRNVFLDVKTKNVKDLSYERNKVSPPAIYPREAFTLPEHITQDVYYENIKPVISFLRIMGVLPFSRPHAGYSVFRIASAPFAYSFIVLACLVVYVAYVSINRVKIVRSLEGRFEEAVIGYLFIVNMFPTIMVPMLWYETTKLVKVFNNWTDFEECYRRVSGKALRLNIGRKALAIAIILPILSTISVFVTHNTMVYFKLSQVIPYCYLDTLTYMMGAYWYLNCEILSEAANILAEDFQQALRHIGPAAMVSDYRALWLRLSKLTHDTGTATCYTFTFLALYLFLIITLSIYGLLSQLSEGFGVKDIGLAVTACCSICLLFFICDEAHYASHHVRTNFQKKLLMVELSWMNSDAQTEINMFLRATEMNPSDISLGGFFDVNRNLFKSLLATMVTYLVVLLQFQISIPEDTSASGSGATVNDNSTLTS